MEQNIGTGLIIGAAIGTSLYVYNSEKFNTTQKTFLLICIIFPPLQWVSILVILAYNNFKHKTSNEEIERNKVKKTIHNNKNNLEKLKSLKEKGILTEEEYKQKISSINNSRLEGELKLSGDYLKLKSLFDDGILTKQEFENKIRILKNNWKNSANSYSSESESNKEQNIGDNSRTIYSSSSSGSQYETPKFILKKIAIALFIALYPLPFIAYAETVQGIGIKNFAGAFAFWFFGAILWLILLKNKQLKPSILILTILYTVGMVIYIFS